MSVNWQKLDLTKASLVKKEVDYVLATLEDSLVNDSFSNNGRSNPMVDAIRQRIEELENFYIQHNDGEN